MILRSAGGPLQVAFDSASGRVTDIGKQVDANAAPRFLFTGIYLVNREFIDRVPAATKISVVPIFCDMIRAGAKLGGIVIDRGHWWDLGNRESYLAVHRDPAQGTAVLEYPTDRLALPGSAVPEPVPGRTDLLSNLLGGGGGHDSGGGDTGGSGGNNAPAGEPMPAAA